MHMKAFFRKPARLIRSQFFPLADQVIVSGGNFLTIALSANFLGLQEQGKLGLIITAYGAIMVANLALIFQRAAIDAPQAGSPHAYRSLLAGFQLLAALPIAVLVLLILYFLGAQSGWRFTREDFLLVGAFLLLQQLASFDRRSAYILNRSRYAVLSSALIYIPRLATILLVRPVTVRHILSISILSCLIPAARTIYFGLRSLLASLPDTLRFIRAHTASARWLILAAPLDWLWANIPVYFLGSIAGLAAVGVLTAVSSIANVGNILIELLETEGAARLGRLKDGDGAAWRKGLLELLLVGLLGWAGFFAVFALFGGQLLVFILGDKYSDYGMVLLTLWIAKFFFFLFRINAIRHRTKTHTAIALYGFLFGCILLLLILAPVIRRFGVLGAAAGLAGGALFIIIGQEFARLFFQKAASANADH